MKTEKGLIPHLFRTEYSKLTAVLGRLFGFEHIEVAEDIVSDTFMIAAETWGQKGLPENPVAWLYTVAKNKAKDHLKRNSLFSEKVAAAMTADSTGSYEIEIDLSGKNISDSLLQMMFAICHPTIPAEAQIALSLRILCGFGIDEIADAFLTSKSTINKRLFRAKEKLRTEYVKIEFPPKREIGKRLNTVLTTLYLLFNEGYYSMSQNISLRKDLCLEAMRLTLLLTENVYTNEPQVSALLALMCFHASRFEARMGENGESVLYEEQDTALWDQELITKGLHFLSLSGATGQPSKYHIEAAIAYWHTNKTDNNEKWESILQLYNILLLIEYSPAAALNRTYALARADGKEKAIIEAEKLKLDGNYLYHCLLGFLYTDIDGKTAVHHFDAALKLTRSIPDRQKIQERIKKLQTV